MEVVKQSMRQPHSVRVGEFVQTLGQAGRMAAGAIWNRGGGGLVTGVSRARVVQGDTQIPEQTDVVVIGGGIVGCLTALTLAERGVRVLLCEKGVIAGEASGRALGYVESQFLDPAKLEIVARSKTLWAGMNERVQGETGYRITGLATFFTSNEGLDSARQWLDDMTGAPGIDARIVGAAEAAELAMGAATPFAGALYQPGDGCVEPQLAAPAIADAVRRAGGVVVQHCAVRGVEIAGGAVVGVVTELGAVRCQAVVLAGGAWSPVMARSLGLDLPQFMAFSGVARVSPGHGPDVATIAAEAGFAMRRTIDGAFDMCTAVGSSPILPGTLRNLFRLGPAMRNMGSQLRPVFNLSTFMEEWRIPTRWALDKPSPFEQRRILMPETRTAFLHGVVDKVTNFFPMLALTARLEQWSGALTSTLDNMPVISGVAQVPGLYLGTGFYYGLTMAPAAGEALADLVLGQTPRIDLTSFRYERFSDGSPIVFRA
ncbi:NAD(P)/FAD-dependent oxidoreductase [Burkholderia multivorans]|uniref:NAD(P)/FAD-dependent oxidoreductase n=1 Tax=Burkholderia multivorans TaxID=87883 RepID=UPI001C26C30C|nr:FAD-binding oxidoreductase [Burkholderia multivorans]MBU9597077.1 FAD-binding oxidoreductase [Burkholderia multivorans]MDN7997021.1 FAD-binding oxidoreductase [Burkholderia multivorans]WVN01574.1 FAD-binding oxidoreductase [Burkholderia multivorans]